MALKDWKKVGMYKWQKIHSFRHNHHPIITIEVPNAFGKSQRFDVVQVTTDGRLVNKIKSFKSKSQALKFAKSYMRKH
jgi:hypothetical protein